MNYHHAYHAGHSADIFKHFTLYQLLKTLCKKDKPLSYLETHAGFAYYDLKATLSQTTLAFQAGIQLLWDAAPTGELGAFLALIQTLHQQLNVQELQYYPGSAWFAHQLLRPLDVMFLADINPEAAQHLKARLKSPPKIHIYNQDGYALLPAWLPPKPARGLVLIDPPYEKSADWDQVIQACKTGFQRWPHGTYAIWYPIKTGPVLKHFYQQLATLPFENILAIEFCPLAADVGQRLNGTGIVLINPPWQFEITLNPLLETLLEILKISHEGYCQFQTIR